MLPRPLSGLAMPIGPGVGLLGVCHLPLAPLVPPRSGGASLPVSSEAPADWAIKLVPASYPPLRIGTQAKR
jgi:hypothetical protein